LKFALKFVCLIFVQIVSHLKPLSVPISSHLIISFSLSYSLNKLTNEQTLHPHTNPSRLHLSMAAPYHLMATPTLPISFSRHVLSFYRFSFLKPWSLRWISAAKTPYPTSFKLIHGVLALDLWPSSCKLSFDTIYFASY
jgi:hypothetical protein